MNIDVKTIIAKIRRMATTRPVEILVCASAFLFIELEGGYTNTFLLMPIVFGVVYALNNTTTGSRWHWAYFASAALIVVALSVDAAKFVNSMAYGFSLILAMVAMLLSHPGRSDRSEGENMLNLGISALMALVVLGAVCLLATLIIQSVVYIFGIKCDAWAAIAHVARFAACIVAPVTFLISVNANVGRKIMRMRFFDILFNYIFGGAIILYTAILYVYLLKIVVTWQLPLGGLAAMITAFYIVAFTGMLINRVIPNRFCNWYYNYFGYISLPLLVLFWTGLAYRIMQYSFTESRVYMALAGVTMLVGSVVLIAMRGKRFAIILAFAALLIATFTYIPIISARNIGLNCQRSRMMDIVAEMGIYDSKLFKIKYLDSVPEVQVERYNELVACYKYLCNETSREAVETRYGKINENVGKQGIASNEIFIKSASELNDFELEETVDLKDYTRFVPNHSDDIIDNNVVVTIDSDTIINQPLRRHVDKDGKVYFTHDDHIYTTDKYMFVIGSISYNPKMDNAIIYFNNYLFTK
ncbi:MAG: DUF4153 domain-containing protein [Muribaculaceae bacterium]